MAIPQCRENLCVKLSTAQVGLGDKNLMGLNSILFCILPALSLGVPLLSCWFALLSNAGPTPALSDLLHCLVSISLPFASSQSLLAESSDPLLRDSGPW